MSEIRSHPWKLTAIGMALVGVTALATGLVVANWSGRETASKPEMPAASPATVAEPQAPRPASTAATPPAAAPAAPQRVAGPPPQAVVDACNEQAARQAGAQPEQRDKALNVAKDAGIGALGGAAVGALGGAVVKGGKGAGKGAAIGGVLGAGGGTLYGINENHKHNEQYRTAYASCLSARGYGRQEPGRSSGRAQLDERRP